MAYLKILPHPVDAGCSSGPAETACGGGRSARGRSRPPTETIRRRGGGAHERRS
jgi:hypothetical protein